MIVLGIDPSLETGAALVDFHASVKPTLVACTCIKAPRKDSTLERLDFIIAGLTGWLAEHTEPDAVAIELPAVGRMKASPMQWRLIGRIENALSAYPITTVTPGKAKQAVGVAYHSPDKPVCEVEALLGLTTPVSPVKYVREAVSDAVAVAVAAHQQIAEDAA